MLSVTSQGTQSRFFLGSLMAMGLLEQNALNMQKNRSVGLHVRALVCAVFDSMSASLQLQVMLHFLCEIIWIAM